MPINTTNDGMTNNIAWFTNTTDDTTPLSPPFEIEVNPFEELSINDTERGLRPQTASDFFMGGLKKRKQQNKLCDLSKVLEIDKADVNH